MEILFLVILIASMMGALISGFPVAFALPGAAIFTIASAALCGWLFSTGIDAYFVYDGPIEWLSAGVTNFRSLYWLVERDTLIAIPLFIFMGVVLQRSKIAEDLLMAMARLFGPVPGGVGLSVVLVGALLAATTGIVGATVVAMGLISLPSMLKNNYSKPLATGTICAAGSLGQIIPPSIVLIILADQLSNAADRANSIRKTEYQLNTGEFSMPAQFDVVSASAGDMFMGALIPGLILVGLYMIYIIAIAFFRPQMAPAIKAHSTGISLAELAIALLPPLCLIFIVLGSIILGIATVNQAGAVGAVGAIIMASYRLFEGDNRIKYAPLLLALTSIVALSLLQQNFNLNIKNIESTQDYAAVLTALFFAAMLLFSLAWGIVRMYRHEQVLQHVMAETTKTTTMVFVILIGAAMLTSAFRAFGGEELVREFLTQLPGGFWTQFWVVMLIIFLLGFFLDFIEIAVVVVPIVAPILLADPSANITAIWFGVMVGLNIQTSFLTPPFGFSLFYLRGAAPKSVKTSDIYKGASAFICLQLLGLIIVGLNPSLVNYIPNKIQLSSENSPPPINPKLQPCLEQIILPHYQQDKATIMAAINSAQNIDFSVLPKDIQNKLATSFNDASAIYPLLSKITQQQDALNAFLHDYKPIQQRNFQIERQLQQVNARIDEAQKILARAKRNQDVAQQLILETEISQLQQNIAQLKNALDPNWQTQKQQYKTLASTLESLFREYRMQVDRSYEPVAQTLSLLTTTEDLIGMSDTIQQLPQLAFNAELPLDNRMRQIEALENELGDIEGGTDIRRAIAKGRRLLDDNDTQQADVVAHFDEAQHILQQQLKWRQSATNVLPQLQNYNDAIKDTIGLRLQKNIPAHLVGDLARCQAQHKDVSLFF